MTHFLLHAFLLRPSQHLSLDLSLDTCNVRASDGHMSLATICLLRPRRISQQLMFLPTAGSLQTFGAACTNRTRSSSIHLSPLAADFATLIFASLGLCWRETEKRSWKQQWKGALSLHGWSKNQIVSSHPWKGRTANLAVWAFCASPIYILN